MGDAYNGMDKRPRRRPSVPACIAGYAGDPSELNSVFAIWFEEDDTFFCMDDFIFTTVQGSDELLASVVLRGMVGGQVRLVGGPDILREARERDCLGVQVFYAPEDIRRYIV